jgi:hypothetical protein
MLLAPFLLLACIWPRWRLVPRSIPRCSRLCTIRDLPRTTICEVREGRELGVRKVEARVRSYLPGPAAS